jgi:hypothetical protein
LSASQVTIAVEHLAMRGPQRQIPMAHDERGPAPAVGEALARHVRQARFWPVVDERSGDMADLASRPPSAPAEVEILASVELSVEPAESIEEFAAHATVPRQEPDPTERIGSGPWRMVVPGAGLRQQRPLE